MGTVVRVGPAEDERADGILVAAVRDGEDGAFEVLFARYRRRIATFVYGMVGDWARAEDITQEVFLSALRRMRETEREIAFKPWIYEIAKNATFDHFRRARRAEEVSIDADGALAPGDEVRLAERAQTPEAALERSEQVSDLVGAFGGLSESHHDILVLRELEGLSYRQIGEQMGLSRPSVESTLFRARRRLSEEYDELRSGRRCEGVCQTIAATALQPVGVRERRRMRRHLAHCVSCRLYARQAGIPSGTEEQQGTGVGAKVAALLPFPLLARRKGRTAASGGDSAAHLPSLTQLTVNVAPVLQPLAGGWPRAAAAALTVAVAGAGAGLATRAAETTLPRHPAPAASARARPAHAVPPRARSLAAPAPARATPPLRLSEHLGVTREMASGIQKLTVAPAPSATKRSIPAPARTAPPRALPAPPRRVPNGSRVLPLPRVPHPGPRIRVRLPRVVSATPLEISGPPAVSTPVKKIDQVAVTASKGAEKVLGPSTTALDEIARIAQSGFWR